MSIVHLASQAVEKYTGDFSSKVSVTQQFATSNILNRSDILSQFFAMPGEDKIDFIDQYGDDLWVYICTNRIAQSSSRIPVVTFKRRSRNGTKGITKAEHELIRKKYKVPIRPYDLKMASYFSTREASQLPLECLYKLEMMEEATDSDLQRLLDKPNPFFTKYYLIEGSTTYLELRGDSFIEMVGAKGAGEEVNENNPPVELWHLNPDKVTVVPSETEYVGRYIWDAGITKLAILKENVVHLRYFNPRNMYRGQGTLQALSETMRQEQNTIDFQKQFYKQGMKPSAVLRTDEGLSDHQYDRLQATIQSNYGGLKNMHRPLLLEGGLEWQSMAITQREADMLAFRKLDREEYLAAFGVPPIMVGLPTENFATAREARRMYYLDTIMPKIQNHEEKINNEIAPLFGEEFFVKFDFSDTPAMQVDTENFIKSITTAFQNGWVTRNEARMNLDRLSIELSDIDLGKEGDTFFQTTNIIPLGADQDEALNDGKDLEEPKDEDDDGKYYDEFEG
tara:strand:+ start:3135 stop:4658 length:1524 start_codon:yes stop_codon:yes gene_type:complete